MFPIAIGINDFLRVFHMLVLVGIEGVGFITLEHFDPAAHLNWAFRRLGTETASVSVVFGLDDLFSSVLLGTKLHTLLLEIVEGAGYSRVHGVLPFIHNQLLRQVLPTHQHPLLHHNFSLSIFKPLHPSRRRSTLHICIGITIIRTIDIFPPHRWNPLFSCICFIFCLLPPSFQLTLLLLYIFLMFLMYIMLIQIFYHDAICFQYSFTYLSIVFKYSLNLFVILIRLYNNLLQLYSSFLQLFFKWHDMYLHLWCNICSNKIWSIIFTAWVPLFLYFHFFLRFFRTQSIIFYMSHG